MAKRGFTAPAAVRGRLYVLKHLVGLTFLILPAMAMGQTNLVLNPSFESLSGNLPLNWSPCNSSGAPTLASATPPVDQGARSLRVSPSQAGDVGVCSDPIPVPAGVSIRLAARS